MYIIYHVYYIQFTMFITDGYVPTCRGLLFQVVCQQLASFFTSLPESKQGKFSLCQVQLIEFISTVKQGLLQIWRWCRCVRQIKLFYFFHKDYHIFSTFPLLGRYKTFNSSSQIGLDYLPQQPTRRYWGFICLQEQAIFFFYKEVEMWI